MRIELQNYLKEKGRNITTDILKFWKVNRQKYPNLSMIVRRYNCLIAHHLVQMPRSGSLVLLKYKHVLGSTRLRLKPQNFGSLLFLKYNL